MTRKGLWIAAVVVIVSNVLALGRAGFNRSGEPAAVLDLTERELRLAPREAENTAMVLRLAWIDPAQDDPKPGWFDAAKLASIGFDCGLPVTAENAAHYRAMPPRSTHAAFEYEGEAWQHYIDALPTAAEKELALRRSRLVLVDVGNDPGALRARHPDRRRTVIVSATAGLVLIQERTHPPFLMGRINLVNPVELNVPQELRPALEPMSTQQPTTFDGRFGRSGQALAGEPRYRVTVRWGRSLEPWIETVQPMGGRR